MTNLTLRKQKGKPLTQEELDGNFEYLDQEKASLVEGKIPEDQLPSSAKNHLEKIRWQGRVYLYADKRWVSYSTAYGAGNENMSQTGGVAGMPNHVWTHKGFFLPEGSTIESIEVLGNITSALVTDLEIALLGKSGNGTLNTTGFGSTAESQEFTLLSATPFNLQSTVSLERKVISVNQPVLEDLMMVPYLRPVGTNTTTTFWYGEIIFNIKY